MDYGDAKFYSDAVDMAAADDVDAVVETIGGYTVALTVAMTALENGKSVMTANKAMLAMHADNLTSAAEATGASIGWEAAVGGGIPCIRGLREGLSANNVTYAAGILNGTCNFILTTMKNEGRDFEDVLAEAQALGYAETPPDLDVDGIDTAHKLALVAATANGCKPNFDAVHAEGIRAITEEDVNNADALGYSIKLLGIASKMDDGAVLQRVHPALIPADTALGGTHGVLNGLFAVGDFVGPCFAQGPGAGRDATASAVVADIVDLARGNTVPTFGAPFDTLPEMDTATMDDRVGRYYLRDASGSALESAGIAVEDHHGNCVITGETREADLNAVDHGASQMIRVEGPW